MNLLTRKLVGDPNNHTYGKVRGLVRIDVTDSVWHWIDTWCATARLARQLELELM